MSLFADWNKFMEEQGTEQFWVSYFAKEEAVYAQILSTPKEPITGKYADLAARFDMTNIVFAGFIEGINTSLKAGTYEMDELTEESDISLEVDMPLLYRNMLEAKADWLTGMEQWEDILTAEERKEITKEWRSSKIFVAEQTVGRNDRCPCGSGKKYKKCCGATS